MRVDRMVKTLLFMIVILLAMIAFKPVVHPSAVLAQGAEVQPFYVEPGYTMLRKPDGTAQMYGKVFIDMRNGDVWGFPTLSTDPYPVNSGSSTPPKSHPMYLGQFVLSDAVRK